MGDPANGRYKAFLMVGVAYVLIAVLAPAGAPARERKRLVDARRRLEVWSLIAGAVGAIGAFCVLLAFGAKGQPAVVMSIIFAGAPIVNAIVALSLHPPAGGWSAMRWQFFAGILLAAAGGTMVTLYKPGPAPPRPSRLRRRSHRASRGEQVNELVRLEGVAKTYAAVDDMMAALERVKQEGGTVACGGEKLSGGEYPGGGYVTPLRHRPGGDLRPDPLRHPLHVTLDEAVALHNGVPQGLSLGDLHDQNLLEAEQFLSAAGATAASPT